MQTMSLSAKNENGENSNQPLPTLDFQSIFDKDLGQLAVIFTIKNSPDQNFLPHFSYRKSHETLALRQDYLWESHCYELFLAFNNTKTSPYLEINFSPAGAFNLYYFDSYRTPLQMPPNRLEIGEGPLSTLFNVYSTNHQQGNFWQKVMNNQQVFKGNLAENVKSADNTTQLVMMLDLNGLAEILNGGFKEIWLNPCAVFMGQQEIAYFAYQHANPPDFHTKDYWLPFAI